MELLVVISIIALLMSIMMPALSKVKNLAKKTVCKAGFHSIGLSFGLYGSDYNKYPFPVCPIGQENNAAPQVLPYVIRETFYDTAKNVYGMDPKVLGCPTYMSESVALGRQTYKDLYSRDWTPKDSTSDLSYWAANTTWPAMRPMGVFLLNGIKGSFDFSALKPSDPSSKLLGADMNMFWENPSEYWSCHQSKEGFYLPEGANRLYNDGSVLWFSNKVMAEDETPLTLDKSNGYWVGPYKYTHARGSGRNYYF